MSAASWREVAAASTSEEDALPELSDTEAALALVLGACPPGALLNTPSHPVPCALWHAVYAVVHTPTDVDVEIERLRHQHDVRVLTRPGAGEERLLLRADDYVRALHTSGIEGADVLAKALPMCTGATCRRDELLDAMEAVVSAASASEAAAAAANSATSRPVSLSRRRASSALDALQQAGWLVACARQHDAALAAGPDEAPSAAAGSSDADTWLWGMPASGRLLFTLTKCRNALLALLHKQKFGRALRATAERAPALRKLLEHSRLDLRFVLRDLVGRALIKSTDTATGTVIELTPAGAQAAAAAAPRGKKRGR